MAETKKEKEVEKVKEKREGKDKRGNQRGGARVDVGLQSERTKRKRQMV